MIPVIIPGYQSQDQVDKCIEHLKNQTVEVEIFVRSNDDDNVYFTAAINEGLRKYLEADCEYMIILNQDMYLEPDAVEKMVAFMDSHRQCGIGTPLQLFSEDPAYVVCAGCLDAFPLGKHQHGPLAEFTTDEQVYWGNGACMIFRKEMVQEIGLLDKKFVFICSDSDYCFTARSRGWEVWSIASAKGIHEHGSSNTDVFNYEIEKLKTNDVIRFGKKWLTGQLYKEMSYEGKNCTVEMVSQIMAQLEETDKQLDKENAADDTKSVN